MCFRVCWTHRDDECSAEKAVDFTTDIQEKLYEFLEDESIRLSSQAAWVCMTRHVLDPNHASVIDLIIVMAAPVIVNVELDALEKIATTIKQDLQIIMSPSLTSGSTKRMKPQQGEEEVEASESPVSLKPTLIHSLKSLKKSIERNFKRVYRSCHLPTGVACTQSVDLSIPKWSELKDTHSLYFQQIHFGSVSLQFSIRTSEQKMTQSFLWIADALPLDSPFLVSPFCNAVHKHTQI